MLQENVPPIAVDLSNKLLGWLLNPARYAVEIEAAPGFQGGDNVKDPATKAILPCFFHHVLLHLRHRPNQLKRCELVHILAD